MSTSPTPPTPTSSSSPHLDAFERVLLEGTAHLNDFPSNNDFLNLCRKHGISANGDVDINDHHQPPVDDDPLSQSSDSPWQRRFDDQELRQVIMQDITRTFPDEPVFRGSVMQGRMLAVLFVWAKEHAVVGYRQGMHELVAVLMRDCRKVERVFCMFARMMDWRIMEFYQHQTVAVQGGGDDGVAAGLPPLAKRAHHINTLLATVDPTLHAYLRRHQLEPQLYCIRWFKLLFAREMRLDEVLPVWRQLFEDGSGEWALLDWYAVAVLLAHRQQLLGRPGDDHHTPMLVLMKPMVFEDPAGGLMDRARELREQWAGRAVMGAAIPIFNAPGASRTDSPRSTTAMNLWAPTKELLSGVRKSFEPMFSKNPALAYPQQSPPQQPATISRSLLQRQSYVLEDAILSLNDVKTSLRQVEMDKPNMEHALSEVMALLENVRVVLVECVEPNGGGALPLPPAKRVDVEGGVEMVDSPKPSTTKREESPPSRSIQGVLSELEQDAEREQVSQKLKGLLS